MSRWRSLAILACLLTIVVAALRFGLPTWLLTQSDPTRNALEALSWLAGIGAVLLLIGPVIWKWLKPLPRANKSHDQASIDLLAGRALYTINGHLPAVV